MTDMPKPIRRVVTGHNAQGRSYFQEDGPSPAELTVPGRPGYRVTNLWRTQAPADFNTPDDIADHRGVMPPPGGTVLRIIDWPGDAPRSPEEQRKLLDATFAALYPDAGRRPDDFDPSMHVTATVDYALVMEGEIVALMEDGETTLRAGDVLIQRGTNHGWVNRSGKPARVAFVLIDAQG